eukprot:scaffold555506_cov14-Prasinocladus_malaysianus.AAC.1
MERTGVFGPCLACTHTKSGCNAAGFHQRECILTVRPMVGPKQSIHMPLANHVSAAMKRETAWAVP